MPLTMPNAPVKSGSDEDEYGKEDENDSDSTSDQNSIFVEVFVQEMHDNYSSYGQAKLDLQTLNDTTNGGERTNQASGGWLQLDGEVGKVLYSAKLKYRAPGLPKMFPDARQAEFGELCTSEPICRSKDHDGDTDMAEESK